MLAREENSLGYSAIGVTGGSFEPVEFAEDADAANVYGM